MIRVLITIPLNTEVIDLLSEIPEFEINEKIGLSPEQMREEVSRADALICGDSLPLTGKILEAATDLKLIVAIGALNHAEAAVAEEKGIAVSSVVAGGRAEAAIAILKDFFNV